MSSLLHLPDEETLFYWAGRLQDRPQRKRFLLTKLLEVISYRISAGKRAPPPRQVIGNVFELEPKLLRNEVTPDSRPAVIIPAFCANRKNGQLLQRLATALLSQDAILIFVNDGSTYWPELDSKINVVAHRSRGGPAAARNSGVEQALRLGADVILFTDSDCFPSNDWVCRAKLSFLENPYIHAVSGKTLSYSATWFDRYHEINGTLNGRSFKGSSLLLYGPTCNFAITRRLAEEIRFDEVFRSAACEDIDFCYRLLQAGYRLMHQDAMVVRHDFQYRPWRFVANTWLFVRQFRKYASAESVLFERCPLYLAYFGQTSEIPSVTIKAKT